MRVIQTQTFDNVDLDLFAMAMINALKTFYTSTDKRSCFKKKVSRGELNKEREKQKPLSNRKVKLPEALNIQTSSECTFPRTKDTFLSFFFSSFILNFTMSIFFFILFRPSMLSTFFFFFLCFLATFNFNRLKQVEIMNLVTFAHLYSHCIHVGLYSFTKTIRNQEREK